MTLRLDYIPQQPNYGAEVQENGMIEIPLAGGRARKRQDMYLPGHTVQCTWLLSPEEYPLFMGFFRTDLKNATQPFLVDIYTDVGVPTTHKCRTIDGMPKLTRQSGDGYWVQATLQAEANPTVTSFEENDSFVTYNSSVSDWFFDGVNNRIEMGDVLDKERNVAWSVFGWCATTSNVLESVVAKAADGVAAGWRLLLNQTAAGRVRAVMIGSAGSGNAISVDSSVDIPLDGSLHLVGFTKTTSSAASSVRVYVDGIDVTGAIIQDALTTSSLNAASLMIGARGTGGFFTGIIRDVSIWNKQLSSAEVLEVYGNGTAPPDLTTVSCAANLEGWWKVDGTDTDAASGVEDHSTNNNHGTAAGGLGGDLGYHIVYDGIAADYNPGDSLRIIFSQGVHPTGDIPLDLDGTYVVDDTLGFDNIRLVFPELVNADWYKLYTIDQAYGSGGLGDVISTVTKVPT